MDGTWKFAIIENFKRTCRIMRKNTIGLEKLT